MKRIIIIIVTLAVLVGLILPAAIPAAANAEPVPPAYAQSVNLLAGQSIDVGDVYVWNDGIELYVKYEITEAGWEITETHLYVGKNSPTTSAPGQFPYDNANASEVTDTYVFFELPLSSIYMYTQQLNSKGKVTGVMVTSGDAGVSPGETVYVAAHAVVMRPIEDCWEKVWIIGDVETYGCGEETLLTNYADEFNWGDPAGPCTAGPTLAAEQPAFTNPFIVGTTPTSEFPFNSNKNVGYATDFDVQWTGALQFGGKLTISWSPGASATEKKVVGDGFTTQTFTAYGSSQPGMGWFLDKYPLVVNSLYIDPLDYGTHTINFQHIQGDGTYWDWIKLEKPCVQKETAWGDGTELDLNGNWSMYFEHVIVLPSSQYVLNITAVNNITLYQHDFTIIYNPNDGSISGTGWNYYHNAGEILSGFYYELDSGNAISYIEFRSDYVSGTYTWYPAFYLESNGSLTFVDGIGPDNVVTATGTWTKTEL